MTGAWRAALAMAFALSLAAFAAPEERTAPVDPPPPWPSAAEIAVERKRICAGDHEAARPRNACLLAAKALISGMGVERDHVEAARVLRALCDSGRAQSCMELSRLALDPVSDAHDPAAALSAARDGCNFGDYNGCLTAFSIAVDASDDVQAMYERNAEDCDFGDARACFRAATMIDWLSDADGVAVAADLRQACARGEGHACHDLAMRIYYGRAMIVENKDEGAKAFDYACSLGSTDSCVQLAQHLRESEPARSRALFEAACGDGHWFACGRLAGFLTGDEAAEAMGLRRDACDGGDFPSCLDLATARLEPQSRRPFEEKAVRARAERWCEAGDAPSCWFLAVAEGLIVEEERRNPLGAAIWRRRACRLGFPIACAATFDAGPMAIE